MQFKTPTHFKLIFNISRMIRTIPHTQTNEQTKKNEQKKVTDYNNIYISTKEGTPFREWEEKRWHIDSEKN